MRYPIFYIIGAKALVRCTIAKNDWRLRCSLCILYTFSGDYCLASSVAVIFSGRGSVHVQQLTDEEKIKFHRKESPMSSPQPTLQSTEQVILLYEYLQIVKLFLLPLLPFMYFNVKTIATIHVFCCKSLYTHL